MNRPILLAALFLLAACSPSREESDWAHLPGGCFTMGENPLYAEEGPSHQACVSAFEMTRREITNAQFAAFVEATGYVTRAERGWRADEAGGQGVDIAPSSAVFVEPMGRSPAPLSWWRLTEGANWKAPLGPGSTIEGRENEPVVHVTREDAAAYAQWAGGRLPSEAEWEFAARATPGGEVSPWSDVDFASKGQIANTWQGIFPVRNRVEDGFAGIAPVGSYEANAFGLQDMIGNVWEWTATPYAPSHATSDRAIAGTNGFDPDQPQVSAVGTIKGGSYLCADNYCARFRPAARQAQDLAFGTSHIGFRIVRDANSEEEK